MNDKNGKRECLLINGKPATEREIKRILNAGATQATPKDRSTAPYQPKAFRVLR